MKKILICTDLIISNFFSETNLNVFQIHNNWNTYFFNNSDDVMRRMKKFLLIQLFLGCIIPVNAGIYYYHFYQNGIKVRCGDNQPRHLISFKAGRAMLFEDDGDEKYKFPETFLYPEKPDEI